jgi:hypothetical protein
VLQDVAVRVPVPQGEKSVHDALHAVHRPHPHQGPQHVSGKNHRDHRLSRESTVPVSADVQPPEHFVTLVAPGTLY